MKATDGTDIKPQLRGEPRMATDSSFLLATEILAALFYQAERAAERVASVLRAWLPTSFSREQPLYLPRGFLLHFAAALQILEWEQSGLDVHRAHGLPSAETALRDAFASLNSPQQESEDLPALLLRVIDTNFRCFSWSCRELGDNIVVDNRAAVDDAFLDAVAQYIWNHRHD